MHSSRPYSRHGTGSRPGNRGWRNGREYLYRAYVDHGIAQLMEETMTWNTPTLIEICIGLEINGYLPAEF
jgi:coenzyme PQQ precursor peptide PqqA